MDKYKFDKLCNNSNTLEAVMRPKIYVHNVGTLMDSWSFRDNNFFKFLYIIASYIINFLLVVLHICL